MVRKSIFIVLGIALVLSLSTVVFAQEIWQWNSFTAEYEKFKYEITVFNTQYDYDVEDYVTTTSQQYQLLELVQVDEETTEVTIANTYNLPTDGLGDSLTFMGGFLSLPSLMSSGDWFGEFMMLGFFAMDLELEVGSSMQTFDGSRIRVIEKQTVADVEGYLCRRFRRDTDADGNRVETLTSEWVIAPHVGWPLKVQVFENGEVIYIMELVEYERK